MTDPHAPVNACATTPIHASVSLVSIFCSDHRRLAGWYVDTFGFTEIDALTSPIFTALAAGPVALGFHHADAYGLLGLLDEQAASGTRLHCTFDAGEPAEIDVAADRLVAAGARLIKAPFDTYYGARQIVFADPEGNVMRLSSSQPELLVHPGPAPSPTSPAPASGDHQP